ncbi:MAG: NPCBM/NEW2 domain-containing protein [Planctomycetota bacterium]
MTADRRFNMTSRVPVSIVLGIQTFVLGIQTFALGIQTFALGIQTFALGIRTFALGIRTFAAIWLVAAICSFPVVGQPALGQPALGQPALGQPALGQPALGQPAGNSGTLTTISGSKYSGRLIETGTDFVIVSGETEEKIGFDQIQTIEFDCDIATPPEDAIVVDFSCESRLFCRSYNVSESTSVMETAGGIRVEAPNRNIDSVLLKPQAESQQLAQQWIQIQSQPPDEGDAVVIRREGRLEPLEGIIGDITGETVYFDFDGETAPVPRERIEALLYYHATGREIPDPVCQLLLADGSVIMTRSLEVSGNELELTTTSGCSLTVPANLLVRMDFAMGRIVFLSDLEPVSSDWQPLLANELLVDQLRTLNRPRLGISYLGEPLTLEFHPEPGLNYISDVREFQHGIAMKAGSKIVYSLQGKYEILTGLVGFAPTAINGGNLTLRIRCDDRDVFERQLKKSDMDNPIELDIPVNDIDRLVIEIEYLDGLEIGDTLHFCDMKVSK